MSATHTQLGEFLQRTDLAEFEKLVIRWQFRMCGDFETALWRAIALADTDNIERLRLGFPLHVQGYEAWAWGMPLSLGQKLRGMGLDI